MTAVIAARIADTPILLGDVVLSLNGSRVAYAGKLCIVAPNVAIGWSGRVAMARQAISRLRYQLSERIVTLEEVKKALDSLEDLRRLPNGHKLELIGWMAIPDGFKVIRWASFFQPMTFCENDGDIGDGGSQLRRMLVAPPIGEGNSLGYDEAPMKLINGFAEALFEEKLQRDAWPQTWGAAYDAIVYQEGRFRWLPKLTYIGWDLTVDSDDRIIKVNQAPVVFTQERVHPCTVIMARVVGGSEYEVRVSLPIDRDVDPDMYLRRPYVAVSPYYANYFRVFCPNGFYIKMPFTAVNATREGAMFHAGVDETDPHFQVNQAVLESHVCRMLQEARASYAARK